MARKALAFRSFASYEVLEGESLEFRYNFLLPFLFSKGVLYFLYWMG